MKTYAAAELSLSALVALHNQYADKPVKAFRDKPTAILRVGKLAEWLHTDGTIVATEIGYRFENGAERSERLFSEKSHQPEHPAPKPYELGPEIVHEADECDAVDEYANETPAQREERLAGLSFNEAEERGASVPVALTTQEQMQASVAGATPAPAPAAPKRRGPPALYADTALITAVKPLAEARRGTTASSARYALYREGMTVAEYLNAAGALQGSRNRWRGDLAWDVRHGHIKIATA